MNPVKHKAIEWNVAIKMLPDLDCPYDDINEPFGVVLSVARHNWTAGIHTEYETAGVWGFDIDTPMMEVLKCAQEQFEDLKNEYPGVFDNIVVDEKTPARFY